MRIYVKSTKAVISKIEDQLFEQHVACSQDSRNGTDIFWFGKCVVISFNSETQMLEVVDIIEYMYPDIEHASYNGFVVSVPLTVSIEVC